MNVFDNAEMCGFFFSFSLEQVADSCYRSLERLDEELYSQLAHMVEKTLGAADTREMKEVKGMSDRLSGMDKIMMEVKKLMQEQNDLCVALVSNKNRSVGLRDTSILPDLCDSHRKQVE